MKKPYNMFPHYANQAFFVIQKVHIGYLSRIKLKNPRTCLHTVLTVDFCHPEGAYRIIPNNCISI